MACPEEIMQQEERYLAALQSAVAIRESARSIELFDENQPILLFNAD
jgi:heat shock protein HslJ